MPGMLRRPQKAPTIRPLPSSTTISNTGTRTPGRMRTARTVPATRHRRRIGASAIWVMGTSASCTKPGDYVPERGPECPLDVYCCHMRRTQIYITEDQDKRVAEMAKDR